MCCVHLAVLGTIGGGLASSAHELLLQRLAAVIAQHGIAAVALGRCVLRPWHLESLGTLVKRQAAWANGVANGGGTGRQGPMFNIRNINIVILSPKILQSCAYNYKFLRSLLETL